MKRYRLATGLTALVTLLILGGCSFSYTSAPVAPPTQGSTASSKGAMPAYLAETSDGSIDCAPDAVTVVVTKDTHYVSDSGESIVVRHWAKAPSDTTVLLLTRSSGASGSVWWYASGVAYANDSPIGTFSNAPLGVTTGALEMDVVIASDQTPDELRLCRPEPL